MNSLTSELVDFIKSKEGLSLKFNYNINLTLPKSYREFDKVKESLLKTYDYHVYYNNDTRTIHDITLATYIVNVEIIANKSIWHKDYFELIDSNDNSYVLFKDHPKFFELFNMLVSGNKYQFAYRERNSLNQIENILKLETVIVTGKVLGTINLTFENPELKDYDEVLLSEMKILDEGYVPVADIRLITRETFVPNQNYKFWVLDNKVVKSESF